MLHARMKILRLHFLIVFPYPYFQFISGANILMILGRISEQVNEECHKQERRYCICSFLCPCHKMAEGHIELTLSVCVCVFQIRVQPITSFCMVGFKTYLAQMINKTRRCAAYKNHVTRSKVKVTAKVKVTVFLGSKIRVRPITSSCIVGFKNYLAQMITGTRWCVACKNHDARSDVKVTVGTLSFCILKSCPTHNFIMLGRI